MALSAMKASRVTEFFAADIARWERTLASVSETLEAVLQVLHICGLCSPPYCIFFNASNGAKEWQIDMQNAGANNLDVHREHLWGFC